ncbi:MAG: Fur family transcriptional regulator [Nitrospiria bacterium]
MLKTQKELDKLKGVFYITFSPILEWGSFRNPSRKGVRVTKEEEILQDHITTHRLKVTKERKAILRVFMNTERHVTAEELHREMKNTGSSIGLATIYRTLNLFCESGLAEQRHFGDGQARYELTYNVHHHDHLVCKQCNRIIEFENREIERLQEKVAKKNRFTIDSHKLELYGTCETCTKSNAKSKAKN